MKNIEIKIICNDGTIETFNFDSSADTLPNMSRLKKIIKHLNSFVKPNVKPRIPLYIADDELLTSEEAAIYLGLHPNYMHMNRKSKNCIPYVKKEVAHCQKKIFYRKSILDKTKEQKFGGETVEVLL